jgi:hypothetical protein
MATKRRWVREADYWCDKCFEEEMTEFPNCQSCETGELVPLSDFGGQGSAVHFKAWVCINPSCGFNLKIRNGDVYVNEPILEGKDRQRPPERQPNFGRR